MKMRIDDNNTNNRGQKEFNYDIMDTVKIINQCLQCFISEMRCNLDLLIILKG